MTRNEAEYMRNASVPPDANRTRSSEDHLDNVTVTRFRFLVIGLVRYLGCL